MPWAEMNCIPTLPYLLLSPEASTLPSVLTTFRSHTISSLGYFISPSIAAVARDSCIRRSAEESESCHLDSVGVRAGHAAKIASDLIFFFFFVREVEIINICFRESFILLQVYSNAPLVAICNQLEVA